MQILVWAGAACTLLGVFALIWCMVLALRARRSGQPDAEVRAALQRAVALNMAALGISGLGLMMVVAGIMLG